MALNNYGYYPNMYQNAFQNQPVQNQNSGIIWVQGEAGAKSYLVAPNTTVQLWDSENNIIYLKSADATGMPSIKVLDYTIRGNSADTSQNDRTEVFATKDDVLNIQKQLDELKKNREVRKNGKKSNADD